MEKYFSVVRVNIRYFTYKCFAHSRCFCHRSYLFWFARHIIPAYTKFECFVPHTRARARWPQQPNFLWWMLGNTMPNYGNGCPYLLVAIQIETFFILKPKKTVITKPRHNRKLSFRNRDTKESYHSATVTFTFYLFWCILINSMIYYKYMQWQRLINFLYTIVTRPAYFKS